MSIKFGMPGLCWYWWNLFWQCECLFNNGCVYIIVYSYMYMRFWFTIFIYHICQITKLKTLSTVWWVHFKVNIIFIAMSKYTLNDNTYIQQNSKVATLEQPVKGAEKKVCLVYVWTIMILIIMNYRSTIMQSQH